MKQLMREVIRVLLIAVKVNPVIHIGTIWIRIGIRSMRFNEQITVWCNSIGAAGYTKNRSFPGVFR